MLPEAWIFAGCWDGHVYYYKTAENTYADDGISSGTDPVITGLAVTDWTVPIWTTTYNSVQGRTLSGSVESWMSETTTRHQGIDTDTYYMYVPNSNSKLYIYEKP